MNNITIEYLFQLLLRRIWIVIVSGLLCGMITFTYCSLFATEIYSASAKVIIGNGAFSFGEEDEENVDLSSDISSLKSYSSYKISGSDIQSSMYLANTCKELLQAQPIYEQLAEAMGENKNTYNSFKRSITVDLASEDSIFITITAKSTSPEKPPLTAVRVAGQGEIDRKRTDIPFVILGMVAKKQLIFGKPTIFAQKGKVGCVILGFRLVTRTPL